MVRDEVPVVLKMLQSLLLDREVELIELVEEIDVEELAARFELIPQSVPNLDFERVCVILLTQENANVEFHRRRQSLVLLLQAL